MLALLKYTRIFKKDFSLLIALIAPFVALIWWSANIFFQIDQLKDLDKTYVTMSERLARMEEKIRDLEDDYQHLRERVFSEGVKRK